MRRNVTWTKEEDAILALRIIDSVKNGKYINDGVTDAALELKRSHDGCRYRWREAIRPKYSEVIEIVKAAKLKGAK